MSRDSSSHHGGGKSRAKAKTHGAPAELENQFILRLPEDQAELLQAEIRNGTLKDNLSIEILGDSRHGTVKYRSTSFSAKLMDLPCVIESWKTLDKKSFWKTADISQLLSCVDEETIESSSDEDDSRYIDSFKKQQAFARKFQYPHGLTPPLKNVRKKRFRKTAKKKYIEAPEVEKEVKRLLRADISAVDVRYEVLQDEDKQEDNRSNASDLDVGTSLMQSPSNINEDSMQFGGSEFEGDESAILPDISSSEGEVDMVDFEHENSVSKDSFSGVVPKGKTDVIAEQMVELQQMLLEVQSKREEQELRVQNAANPYLKQRFQGILDGLLQKESALLCEINELQLK